MLQGSEISSSFNFNLNLYDGQGDDRLPGLQQ